MIQRLIVRRKPRTQRKVWGIWCDPTLQLAYKAMAAELRVPISVLVGHILIQWLAKNGETMLGDEATRAKYGDFLARKYLAAHKFKER